MKTTAIGLTLASTAIALLSAGAHAQTTATTPPVGFYTLNIVGGADNVMSLPMVRDSVFAGTVAAPITANSFNVNAGQVSPGWNPSQWVYSAGTQRLTYYVEFTSGQLRGLYYKITANTANSLTLDTEGDDLTNHPINGAAAALQAGDSITIRPYWTIKDVFEVGGQPIIQPRPFAFQATDDILIPNYTSVGINKSAQLTIYYLNGVGWREFNSGAADFADFILRPNEAFVLRRRNAAPLSLTNLGSVLMNRAVSFVSGGNGINGNDTYISLSRPAAVKLDDSGLRIADQNASLIKDTQFVFDIQDTLLAFNPPSGQNEAPSKTYYYLSGQGWRDFNNPSDTTIGQTVFLEPGKAYIVRKKAANTGRDWVNDPNY